MQFWCTSRGKSDTTCAILSNCCKICAHRCKFGRKGLFGGCVEGLSGQRRRSFGQKVAREQLHTHCFAEAAAEVGLLRRKFTQSRLRLYICAKTAYANPLGSPFFIAIQLIRICWRACSKRCNWQKTAKCWSPRSARSPQPLPSSSFPTASKSMSYQIGWCLDIVRMISRKWKISVGQYQPCISFPFILIFYGNYFVIFYQIR